MLDTKMAPFHKSLACMGDAVRELQVNAVHVDNFRPVQEQVNRVESLVQRDHSRVDSLEQQITHLKSKLEKLELSKRQNTRDDSFKQIAFLGLPDGSYADRVGAMRKFMNEHFKDFDFTVSVFNKYAEGGRQWTNTGYTQFASKKVRDIVFGSIEQNKLKFKMNNKEVAIKKARSYSATLRNKAIRKAAEMLEKMADNPEDVTIQWAIGGVLRGVTIRGVYAFEQAGGDDEGKFTRDYAHLEMPV